MFILTVLSLIDVPLSHDRVFFESSVLRENVSLVSLESSCLKISVGFIPGKVVSMRSSHILHLVTGDRVPVLRQVGGTLKTHTNVQQMSRGLLRHIQRSGGLLRHMQMF